MTSTSSITVFEHEAIRTDRGEKSLSPNQLKALQAFYGENGVPYYTLIHQGIKFNEYVGVLQVGKTTVEILPKADKRGEQELWRKVLISMLKAVGTFNLQAPSSSSLKLKANSVLDFYFELFISEVEHLLHRGLVKNYRRTEGNSTAMKGSINFSKHIQSNLIHKERFFVRHTVYDCQHPFNRVLFKTLRLLKQINTNASLHSRLGALLLDFPELPDIKISEAFFNKIQYDRKKQPYRKAIEIARFLLLNYHPDVSSGQNHVLALMFDMNLLWEKFVYASLKKFGFPTTTIAAQNTRDFWKPDRGYKSKIKPDIVLNKDQANCVVLDTKWKNLNGYNPSPDDLRQMFVYSKFYGASKTALLYPGQEGSKRGRYFDENSGSLTEMECSIISIPVKTDGNIKDWQQAIHSRLQIWIGPEVSE